MMKIITVLLCALTNQVICQTKDISPAKILAQQKTVGENGDLYLTCSTFGKKKHSTTFVFLLKDGHAIKAIAQKQDQNDITFSISRARVHHSGNYSCVCSPRNYTLSEIDQRGDNVIEILVISSFLLADISVVGSSTVYIGDHVEFRCRVSDILHTLGECRLILSYLRNNETMLQLRAFNVSQMETTFSIKGALARDSGHYSCIVLPTKCIQENEKALSGGNTVFLEVKVDMVLRVFVTCGVMILMVLLSLCLWGISKVKQGGHSASCNPCAMSQQANADMLEQQPEQAEEEHLEAQNGEDSFCLEEEEDFQNSVTSEDYSEAYGAVYSVPDDSMIARPSAAPVYAASTRRKKHEMQLSPEFNVS